MPKTRLMYIEDKSSNLVGEARIGRGTFSKRGRTIRDNGAEFQSLRGSGFKANYFCVETGAHYWISGPRQDGADGLYGYRPTPIDEDARDEYRTSIRKRPDLRDESMT